MAVRPASVRAWQRTRRSGSDQVSISAGRTTWRRRANELTHGPAFVAAEIVHDDHVAGPNGGHQNLLDTGRKLTPSIGPSMNQCASIRSWRRADRQGSHTVPGPSLIDEDQMLSFDAILIFCPLAAPARYVGTIALSSHNAFF